MYIRQNLKRKQQYKTVGGAPVHSTLVMAHHLSSAIVLKAEND